MQQITGCSKANRGVGVLEAMYELNESVIELEVKAAICSSFTSSSQALNSISTLDDVITLTVNVSLYVTLLVLHYLQHAI